MVLNYLAEVQGITEKSNRLVKLKMKIGVNFLDIASTDMKAIDGIKKSIQKIIDTIIGG